MVCRSQSEFLGFCVTHIANTDPFVPEQEVLFSGAAKLEFSSQLFFPAISPRLPQSTPYLHVSLQLLSPGK